MIGKAGTALVPYPDTYELRRGAIEKSAESKDSFGCLSQPNIFAISTMHVIVE